MHIHNYKVGDTVKIVSSRHSFQWYNTKIGQEYKVSCVDTSFWDYLLVNVDGVDKGVLLKDIVVVQKWEKEVPNPQTDNSMTTEDAILQLQSLLDMCLDESVSIIIKPTEMSVKTWCREYAVANAEELEQVCKAVSYLSGMEIV